MTAVISKGPVGLVKNGNPPIARKVPLWAALLFPCLAGGMAWGIRGQYGHETGAMLAGLLIGLVVGLLYLSAWNGISSFRAVALFALGIGFGGSMTYGQTIGLTQNPLVVGNWEAWRWGMLGLSIKGALWIGFGGLFLGMGLGGKRYGVLEMAAILAGLLLLFIFGIQLLNRPHDIANGQLPYLYFSANWTWEPVDPFGRELRPRPEVWGGYALAIVGAILYTGLVRRDPLACRLAFWGLVGGAIGFPLGQCLQSYHAWNLEAFKNGSMASFDKLINWWNMMETTFGATMGLFLGLGVWLHQNWIAEPRDAASAKHSAAIFLFTLGVMLLHILLLGVFEFGSNKWVEWLYQYGIPMAALPLLAVSAGNGASFFQVLPVLCIPIAGKTFLELCEKHNYLPENIGRAFLVVLPLALTGMVAVWARLRSLREPTCHRALQVALLCTTWVYFWLNFAFFRFPWWWQPWTARTPNSLIYLACALGLTGLALLAPAPKKVEVFDDSKPL